jgi:hypothetical protein
MSAAALKKSSAGAAFPAAARVFEEITAMFETQPSEKLAHGVLERVKVSLNALRQAPEHERAAVHALLGEVANQLGEFRLLEAGPGESNDDESADSRFERSFATALARVPGPMVTERSKAAGSAFMTKFRAESAAALLSRIESKELLTSAELQNALKIRRQSISDAVKSNRLFALVGPSGENYYPAFYTDPSLDRRIVEKVSKAMGAIPGAAKYSFFTSKSHMLGETPLEALRKGRVQEVLAAATAYGER